MHKNQTNEYCPEFFTEQVSLLIIMLLYPKLEKNSFQAYFIKKKLGSDKLGLVTDSKGRKYLWQPLIFYL